MTRRLSENNERILIDAYKRFGSNTFKRSDFSVKFSFGPLYNTGHLIRRGDNLNLSTTGIAHAKKLCKIYEV